MRTGFRSARSRRTVALKIEGYLGMSPTDAAGMSGDWDGSAVAMSPAARRSSAESWGKRIMVLPLSRSSQRSERQRLDAPCSVDLLGHLEGRIELADAVLLHQLEALGFLFRLGLG